MPKLINGQKMKFIKWNHLDPLKVNTFGFLEPLSNGKNIKPDLAVVPLLAFDKFNNKLATPPDKPRIINRNEYFSSWRCYGSIRGKGH